MGRKKKKKDEVVVEKFGDRLIARNKRASFDYELGDKIEAGLVLIGSEVKVLRQTAADLSDAWIKIERGEAFVCGMNIPEMSNAPWGHKAKRTRKLLLHKHQIEQLQRAIERKGATIIATRLYFRGGRAKLEVATATGKRMIDKRQTVKNREADREARAEVQRFNQGRE